MDTINDHISNLTLQLLMGYAMKKDWETFLSFDLKKNMKFIFILYTFTYFIYFLCIIDCPLNQHIRELICAQKTSQKHNNKDWSRLQ